MILFYVSLDVGDGFSGVRYSNRGEEDERDCASEPDRPACH